MSKLFDEDELEGCMDCFGEFDVTNEICLKYCGINIACASRGEQKEEFGWIEEEWLDLPDLDLD
jgi:hypothetical protein